MAEITILYIVVPGSLYTKNRVPQIDSKMTYVLI